MTCFNRGQERAHLLSREHGSVTLPRAVLRSPHRMGGGMALHQVPGDQPVEEHPDRAEMLFDGGLQVRTPRVASTRQRGMLLHHEPYAHC